MSNSNVQFVMNPIDWYSVDQPNFVLIVSGVVITGATFSADLSVTDSENSNLGYVVVNNVSGFATLSINVPLVSQTQSNFPWTVTGTITADQPPLGVTTSAQTALGVKANGVPACYQVSVFCNDNNGTGDEDWNDFVLNFQLFDNSRD